MATRSYICMELPDHQMLGIYCHWDGYPTGVGACLAECYGARDKAEQLFQYGDMSNIGDTIDECEFYSRDRGEQIHPARIVTEANIIDSWAEYAYLYSLDGNWYVKEAYKDSEWFLLEAVISNPDIMEVK